MTLIYNKILWVNNTCLDIAGQSFVCKQHNHNLTIRAVKALIKLLHKCTV